MENNKGKNLSSFEAEIEKIIKEKNITWDESHKKRNNFGKKGLILTPLSIFLLLFIIPVFNIFNIENSADFLIGIVIMLFLFWFWYVAFKLLFLSGNIVSPWILGLIEKAKEIRAGNLKNSKATPNFLMGLLFVFFGIVIFLSGLDPDVNKGLSLGFGSIFSFLGFIGLLHYSIAKKPEKVLFLLKNNKIINFLFFLFISLFCFFVTKSVVIAIFS